MVTSPRAVAPCAKVRTFMSANIRYAVAMSGGVDSSTVAATLLQ
jgi:PP-loop superfamily ATP-utilizing enzyme